MLRVYTGAVRHFTDKPRDLIYKLPEQAAIAVMNAQLCQGIKNDYDPHCKVDD